MAICRDRQNGSTPAPKMKYAGLAYPKGLDDPISDLGTIHQ
jgi:hypothetical protein